MPRQQIVAVDRISPPAATIICRPPGPRHFVASVWTRVNDRLGRDGTGFGAPGWDEQDEAPEAESLLSIFEQKRGQKSRI